MKTMKKFLLMAVMIITVLGIGQTAHIFAADVTLKAGKWANGTTAEKTDDNVYYKIKISKTGYIKVDYRLDKSPEDGAGVSLYDSKKKLIASSDTEDEVKNETAYFAVKKGTYYLRSENETDIEYNEEDEDGEDIYQQFSYKIRYTFQSFKESGKKVKKLSKAPVLKKNETVKGLMFPHGKEGDDTTYALFKIKIPKKQKVMFQFGIGDNHFWGMNKIRVTLLDAKGRALYNGKYKKNSYTWYENGKAKETLAAGTYYISVEGLFTDATGYYSISWK